MLPWWYPSVLQLLCCSSGLSLHYQSLVCFWSEAFCDSWTGLECHSMPWRHQSTGSRNFVSISQTPKNVFKTAATGSSLQAPQGWDLQRSSLAQTQGKESLSGEVWTHDLYLPAKTAWIILNSVPLQTPSVSQMFPRDHEKLCLPLLPIERGSQVTLPKLVSVNKNLCDLQAQFLYAKGYDRSIAPTIHHNLETVLKRGVLPPWWA